MATIAVAKQSGQDPDLVYLWEAIVAGSLDGESIEIPGYAERSVQVIGTFDGATLTMQGSNDGTTWATLTDPSGAAIALTAAGLVQIMEYTRYVRPLASGGSGSEDLDVYLYAKRVAT